MSDVILDARGQLRREISDGASAMLRRRDTDMSDIDEAPKGPQRTPAAARNVTAPVRQVSAAPAADTTPFPQAARRRTHSRDLSAQRTLVGTAAQPGFSSEIRRCYSCGGEMISARYRRSLMRFVRKYRCSHCRRVFEQDARGFQGFYAGYVATILAPFLYACLSKPNPSFVEIGVVALVTFLAFWPLYVNWGHYLRAPIIRRNSAGALLPQNSGRTLVGRVLGGESRFYGLGFGLITGVITYVGVAIAALMLVRA